MSLHSTVEKTIMTYPALKPVQHAVFDAYGTLFDVHSAASRHQERLGEKAQAISAMWRTKQLEYTWLRSLMQHYVDFWKVTQDALDYALDSHGIEDSSLRQDLLNAYHELSCYPEVPETLRKLKQQGLGTAILSNGALEMLEAGVRSSHLEEVLDAIFSVDTIGIFKPSPQVYQLATDKLACNPEDIFLLPTLGMFPEQPLSVIRPCGSTVLDKRRNGFPEHRFWKSKPWMLCCNICIKTKV